ncbi:MAG: hypothetical protein ACFFBP_00280 [Promethearchaeota archaeon]
MAKVIQDLWILMDTGVVLYHRTFDTHLSDQLFGGLMSALNTFAETIVEGGLSSFELSNKRFNLLKKQGLFFVSNSDKKHKEKKIIPELEKVADKFTERFPEGFFEQWDNDVSIFQKFEDQIGDQLEDPIKKFWDGF